MGGEWTGIFEKVSSHPVIFGSRGDVLHLLTKIAPEDLGASFTRGADKSNRETGLVRHRHDSRFAVPRKPFNTTLLRVHGFISFEVIQCPACAPRPGAQGAPIVQLARLPPIYQADDSLSK